MKFLLFHKNLFQNIIVVTSIYQKFMIVSPRYSVIFIESFSRSTLIIPIKVEKMDTWNMKADFPLKFEHTFQFSRLKNL